MFKDRRDAGERLAEKLKKYGREGPLVLAIPRGGVILADEIVKKIGGNLDLIIPRKIGAPDDQELAIGAVGPDRSYDIDRKLVRELRIPDDYVVAAARIESVEITRRNIKYRGTNDLPNVAGRVVIVVDDGIATGHTMKVVLKFLAGAHAKKIIVAVPVASRGSLKDLEKYADEVVCLEKPASLTAIGGHYRSFGQVSDDQVVKIMRRARG